MSTSAEPVLAPAGLAGEVAIADNFDTAAGLEPTSTATPASTESVGAFRMFCTAGQLLYEDPIVNPGTRAPHLHQFWGNTGANAHSTYKSLRESGGTTCGDTNSPANRSGYWSPAMFDGAGGVVKPKFINMYYKRFPVSSDRCNQSRTDGLGYGICADLPNGLRYVWGFNMATHTGGPADPNSPDRRFMFYTCSGVSGRFQTLAALVDNGGCAVGAEMAITASAPFCWDGKHVDTPDHRAHMAYANRPVTNETGLFHACPTTHPYLIPTLTMHITYTVDANFATWALSSDVQMGMTPGSTFHFDYWEAWSPVVKAEWEKNCIDGHLGCASGDLGNKTRIKKAGVPRGGWPTPEVVASP